MAATDDDPITSWRERVDILRKRARIGDGKCGGR